MGSTVHDYGIIEPNERPPLTFKFDRYSSFKGSSPESIATVEFIVYLASDESQTPIPDMIYSTSKGTSYAIIWVGKAGGMTPETYHVRCKITCVSGSIYEEQGSFIVEETQ